MARSYTPWASTPAVRSVMQSNRRRDTKPEKALRGLLFSRGLRYRVDARPLADLNRRADIVFFGPKVAVFVDGCFWHGCPTHGTAARTNSDYWRTKIGRNRERDEETNHLLRAAGWVTCRVWEHEDLAEAAARIVDLVRGRTGAPA